ncbi:hypothetical protein E2493_04410 [Sphingomonas parva]|uniref:Uncharacterized protein n=1 Tax=Sphingomonas parva TaxID=2555898 RepID=A0A4Y8ZTV4_9SPHN|nr:hypothetical protein [Sphingomonas parva]TFI59441.1 hypothetical protein E2493_04410 [Sphingomonas parva]
MKPILILMLAVDAAIFLLAVYDVVFARGAADRRNWSRFTLPLMIGGIASIQVGERHAGVAAAEVLPFFGALLLGMAVMSILVRLGEGRRARASRS